MGDDDFRSFNQQSKAQTNRNANTPREAALAYARAGLAVFPAPPGTKMSFKAARDYGRPWGATKDAGEIERDWSRWPQANVCIVTGAVSGVFVVETDTAAHGVDGAAALSAVVGLREWPVTLQALSPSGSRHYYFLWPDGGLTVRTSVSWLAPGVDVRGEGGMCVAPPSRRTDGQYRWANDAAIAPAPVWLLDRLAERPRPHRTENTAFLVDAWLVAETMKHVPTELQWEERNRIGMAIWACTGGSEAGFKIWDEWLARSGKYNARKTQQRWAAIHRCPPTAIGYGSLEYRATAANPEWGNELDARQMREMREATSR
jgi:hypothetical protein